MKNERLDAVDHVYAIEWTEPIYERHECEPPTKGHYSTVIGQRMMRGKVHVIIDLQAVAKSMGRRAMTSKGRKATDGFVTVKVASAAEEVNREMIR